MGNIVSLNRNPMGTNTYSYSDNRLMSISGFVNSSYSYDVNGNQTGDSHKGITLDYNYLNLPETISKASTSETMTNTWLATGTKIRKTVGGMTREYVSGIEYNDGIIEFIQTAEGRAIPTGSNGYRYEYMLKDHLGNTRVLLEENGTVLETSDYYPFGLQVARGQTVTSPENRYKYNGKELQTELGLGQYDYGARFYDPVIARWATIDPLADEYEEYSPYNYTLNNPVNAIDPDGQWVLPAIRIAQTVLRNPVVQRELAKLGMVTSAYFGGRGVITQVRNNNAKRDATNVVTNNNLNSQAVTPSKAEIANMKARLEDPKGSESNPQGSSKAARKDVMRKEGIPTSQQPSGQQKSDAGNTDKKTRLEDPDYKMVNQSHIMNRKELLIRQNQGKRQLAAYISQLSLALSVNIKKSDFVDLGTTDSLKEEFYKSYKASPKIFSKIYGVDNESELNSDIFKFKSHFKDQRVFLITKVSEVCGAVKVPASNAIDNYKAIIKLDGDSLNLIALDRKSYFYIDYFEEYGNFFYELSSW